MNSTKEKIVQTARELFAKHGYEGVSTRMLANEVGISVSTLSYHIGSKATLYALVFKDVYLAERELVLHHCAKLSDAVEDVHLLRDALLAFAEAHVDFMVEYPEAPRLWLRRWLAEPGSPAAQIDVDFGVGLYRKIRDLLRQAEALGTLIRPFNMRYFLLGVTWMEYGFFSSGALPTSESLQHEATHVAAIAQFKQHIGLYICNTLGLPLPERLVETAV